ncbi:glycosyltransferase [Mangrovimonas aestuarii]|uniref:glycosyltransferase n=1 Tax=Mangrovimonas aestuarii TaxID=3018443 RepID=UPI002378097C|nr:glycosyltransferase [Mangrovimonas aestuarii]
MQMEFSFIVPVYNRPDEIGELLESFSKLNTDLIYEIVIVEDGSTISSKEVVDAYNSQLNISYFFKENSGPGDSRNFGMQRAKGNYFIILDSDCILPEQYLTAVKQSLEKDYVDCFGGPDTSHASFSPIQKAIDFAMTSFITTGGIRGKKRSLNQFQPRSFNMGLSKKAYQASAGFGTIHPGEDPDLSIRLWDLGFRTKLIPEAYVFHKRRISWNKFYKQVNKFGLVRPILNQWHPKTAKLTYWFPTVFTIGFIIAFVGLLLGYRWLIALYIAYFMLILVLAFIVTKSIKIGILSLLAVGIQFFGYGYGFIKSTWLVGILKRDPKKVFPHLFF